MDLKTKTELQFRQSNRKRACDLQNLIETLHYTLKRYECCDFKMYEVVDNKTNISIYDGEYTNELRRITNEANKFTEKLMDDILLLENMKINNV